MHDNKNLLTGKSLDDKNRVSYQFTLLELLQQYELINDCCESDIRLTKEQLAIMQSEFLDILAEIRLAHNDVEPDQPNHISFMYIGGFPYLNRRETPNTIEKILKVHSRNLDTLFWLQRRGVEIYIGWPEINHKMYELFEKLIPGLNAGDTDRFISQGVNNPTIDYCVFLGTHALGGCIGPHINGGALYGDHILSKSRDAIIEDSVVYGLHALSGSEGLVVNRGVIKGRWALGKLKDSVLIGTYLCTESDFLDSENCILINCQGDFRTNKGRTKINAYNHVDIDLPPHSEGLNTRDFIKALRNLIPIKYRI